MLKRVKATDLRIGMYVNVPGSWLKHPFLKSSFVIKSQDDIDKIIAGGFEYMAIDTAKGVPVTVYDTMSHGRDKVVNRQEALKEPLKEPPQEPPKTWDPEKLIPPELREAIYDKSMLPEKKAYIVYSSSLVLMERLLDDPKAQNIGEAKKGIAEVVDLVLADMDTANSLLNLTNHDFYTYTHSVNVGVLCIMLSKALFRGSNGHNMHELGAGFFLHDIGKVRVDPAIINKPGRLTEEEMMRMRIHPFQGYKILLESGHLTEECKYIVLQHHERDNGMGYPGRLRGEDIHLYGRICCIADVYDALTAERSYKRGLAPFEALKVMKTEMLSFFHRELFEKFVLLFT